MNDFLRQCNCVHPADGQCEKCMEEAAAGAAPGAVVAEPGAAPASKMPASPDAQAGGSPAQA